MKSRAIILGSGSDIGREITKRLCEDGWCVTGLNRAELSHFDWWEWTQGSPSWDLVVCCYGTLGPIGNFWELDSSQWGNAAYVNALLPLRQIRELYQYRKSGASVCFFSGAGANGPAPTYSAYSASKVMLAKMVELMDDESPDCKFFILGPGIVRTKIHEQTLRAPRAANLKRVVDFVESDDLGTSHDDIYACLMACAAASKAAVGGRNIYVPLDDWGRLEELAGDPNMFKLRRYRNEALRRRVAVRDDQRWDMSP